MAPVKANTCGTLQHVAQDSTYFAALQAPILPNVDGVITIMVSAIPSVLLGTPKSVRTRKIATKATKPLAAQPILLV